MTKLCCGSYSFAFSRRTRLHIFIIANILFVGFSEKVHSQEFQTITPHKKVLAYNIGLGTVISGVGSIINRKDKDPFWKTLRNGALKGAAGGTLLFIGKRFASEIASQEKLWFGLPAKVTHTLGMSIIENAALNKRLLEKFHLNLGFIRLDWYSGRRKIPQIRVQPFSLTLFLVGLQRGSLDLKSSIALGTPVVKDVSFSNSNRFGLSTMQTILLSAEIPNIQKTYSHELIHIFQFQEYLLLNALFHKLDNGLNKWQLYNQAGQFIQIDWPFFLAIYQLERKTREGCKFNNFYELEAEYYSTLKPITVCK